MAPLRLLGSMVRAGIIAPLRTDKYLRTAGRGCHHVCRNHRGFAEALTAADRIGADKPDTTRIVAWTDDPDTHDQPSRS